jgi:Xaa-Pro aminopeptidase
MMKRNLLILASFAFLSVHAQEERQLDLKTDVNYYRYDQDFLPASFHKARRDSLRALMPDSSVAFFFASPERNRSNDVYYEYHQDPNFYYLTGYTEPNSLLILFKEEVVWEGAVTDEVLFVQERNPQWEVWNGRRLGQNGAEESLAIKAIELNKNFKMVDSIFKGKSKVFFQMPYAMEEQDTSSTGNLNGLYQHFSNSLHNMNGEVEASQKSLAMMMATLRQEKTEEELSLLQKAIDITCEAQNELMRKITPEMAEYQTEAIVEYVFKSSGAEYTGFPSIQGSGENSCILHYTSNRRPLRNGGLLVSDIGAEYRGYTADVTRTIPPSGKFSKEEKIIYELVLEAQEAGIKEARAGNIFWKPHMAAQEIIAEGLKKLGIIENTGDVRKYFMHGTSHYLGLDVHDAGMYGPLQVNQVITVEPGIYIAEGADCDPKWWNIGVRIEDDILITEGGPVNMSEKAPRKIKEIEALMAGKESKTEKK